METTPVIAYTRNAFIKWIPWLTLAGIATYFGLNYRKNNSLPPIEEVIDDLTQENDMPSDFEKFYWQWKVMTDPKYRSEIMEYMSIEAVSYLSAIRQLGLRYWYANGDLTSTSIRKTFDVEVRLLERVIQASPDWMESTRQSAQDKGISVAESLRVNAAYSVINKYAKRYEIASGSSNNNQQQGGQAGFAGYAMTL